MARSKSKTGKFSRICDSAGRAAQSYYEEKDVFREYFSKLLGGTVQSFETLVHKDRDVQVERFQRVEPSQLALSIPLLPAIIAKFRGMKKGKGHGEDLICTDVYSCFFCARACSSAVSLLY